jgi:4-diphosphocytidyl-2-C-methyl-D-erythritol kinase
MSKRGVARLAPAKINLALHVTGRRADGYHLLDSIAVFADIGDRVRIEDADELRLFLDGPFAAHAPGGRTDLSWRAAVAFFERAGLKPAAAAIHVEKNIPAGAGLGGGSADAAAVLAGLNEYFHAGASRDELKAIGLKLGADVPMCLEGHSLRALGIGEDIRPIEGFPPLPLVLVWPGTTVSTAEVFSSLQRRDNPSLGDVPRAKTPVEFAGWLARCRNDLEPPALVIAPEISDVLAALRGTEGCALARMSGSGSACFGLYGTRGEADAAAAELRAKAPAWWIAATEAR